MLLKFELSHLVLFAFCVYLKCVFTQDVSKLTSHLTDKQEAQKGNIKNLTFNTDTAGSLKVSKKIDQAIEIPLDMPSKPKKGQPQNPSTPKLSKGSPHLVLEGGGIVDLTSTALPNIDLIDTGTADGNINHSKGSKPRKGVQHAGSSVVPRKGVDPLGAFNLNQSSVSVTSDPTQESTNTIGQFPINKSEPSKVPLDQHNENPTPKAPHPKKPVVVTDIEDVDDFEKYSMIQTSTTGEDYIIIGIVIVLGIWCSIFGALIFYRRAGEYWDRRHYRRMDFLVEGMYND